MQAVRSLKSIEPSITLSVIYIALIARVTRAAVQIGRAHV